MRFRYCVMFLAPFPQSLRFFPQEHHQVAFALHLIGIGEKHDADQWLERSYRKGSLWSLRFFSDPILKSLRDEPGYRMSLSMIGYAISRRHGQMSESSSTILVEALRAYDFVSCLPTKMNT
jgi:hypothetical protein